MSTNDSYNLWYKKQCMLRLRKYTKVAFLHDNDHNDHNIHQTGCVLHSSHTLIMVVTTSFPDR